MWFPKCFTQTFWWFSLSFLYHLISTIYPLTWFLSVVQRNYQQSKNARSPSPTTPVGHELRHERGGGPREPAAGPRLRALLRRQVLFRFQVGGWMLDDGGWMMPFPSQTIVIDDPFD